MTKKTTVPKPTKEEAYKAAAIMHAVEVKSSFELYAYRVITHEQYLSRIKELVDIFNAVLLKEHKNELKEELNQQLDLVDEINNLA